MPAGETTFDADTNADYHLTITHTHHYIPVAHPHDGFSDSDHVPYDNDTAAHHARG